MDFYKDGKPDYIKVYGNYGISHKIGDTLELKYLDGYDHHFLFPNENPLYSDLGVVLFFTICGISCLSYAFRKEPPSTSSLY